MIYGFFDTQLTERIENRWSDLFGNRAMVFYVDPSIGLRYIAPDSPWRALQFRLQAEGTNISTYFLNMLPYIFTIAVLVLATQETVRRRVGAPAALGLPYVREER